MTEIIYSIIYLVPLVLVVCFDILPYFISFSDEKGSLPVIIVMLLVSIILALIAGVGSKVRMIIVLGLAALTAGMLLITDSAAREEWIAANTWIWTALAAAVISAGIMLLMIRLRPVKIAAGVVLSGLLISSYWSGIITEKISVVSITFMALVIATEEIRRSRSGREMFTSYVVRISPFLLFGMLLLYMLPYSEEPYDWAFARNIYNRVSDRIIEFVQSLDKSDTADDMTSRLGFAENGDISGNAGGKPVEMMRVVVGYSAPVYLYLDGIYFDEFDGREWTAGTNAGSGSSDRGALSGDGGRQMAVSDYPYMMDMLETLCTLSTVNGAVLNDYRRIESVDITFTGQNSRHVFAPIKTYANDVNVDNRGIDHTGQELLFTKKKGYNTEYKLKYIVLNRKSSVINELLRNAGTITEEDWRRTQKVLGLTAEKYSYQSYLQYRSDIYAAAREERMAEGLEPQEGRNSAGGQIAGQGGDSASGLRANTDVSGLSDEVMSFLRSCTAGAQNDYEKLLALEKAFTGFEYTLTPGALPREVDTPAKFLHYFIVDSGRGYCNSFATAFALLCRAEGIPARYVQGYLVERVAGEYISVCNTMAHAYVQAYVEGLGWLVFDPTPGYSSNVQWDERGEYVFSFPRDIAEGFIYEQRRQAEATAAADTPAEQSLVKWYLIALPVIMALMAVAIFFLIERMINRRRYTRLSSKEKAHAMCLRIMKLLKRIGFAREESETVSEYAARALSELEISLKCFSTTLEKILYSEEKIGEDVMPMLQAEYDLIYGRIGGMDKVLTDVQRFLYLS